MSNYDSSPDHIPTVPLADGDLPAKAEARPEPAPAARPALASDARPEPAHETRPEPASDKKRDSFLRRRWVRVAAVAVAGVLLLGIGAGLGAALEDADDWWDAAPQHSEIEQRAASSTDAS